MYPPNRAAKHLAGPYFNHGRQILADQFLNYPHPIHLTAELNSKQFCHLDSALQGLVINIRNDGGMGFIHSFLGNLFSFKIKNDNSFRLESQIQVQVDPIMGSLAGDVVDRLDAAEAAREADMIETAEESYAQAIDLMVELKFQSAAQPGRSRFARSARAQLTQI